MTRLKALYRCQNCGDEFHPDTTSARLYCSPKCRGQAASKRARIEREERPRVPEPVEPPKPRKAKPVPSTDLIALNISVKLATDRALAELARIELPELPPLDEEQS